MARRQRIASHRHRDHRVRHCTEPRRLLYARLQFEDLPSADRSSIEATIWRYCELDSLAVVMIYEAWRQRCAETPPLGAG
jgi:hypothetical protein